MPVRFVPSTAAPTHPGRFLAPEPLGLTGRPGGQFLRDVLPNGWQVLKAAFGANPEGDPGAWIWTDITRWAQWDDGLQIKIGYEDESVNLSPASLAATLRNDQPGGGDFTVDNATGAYAGLVVENVPIYAALDVGNGESLLFQGYATSWAPEWDHGNEYAVVHLLANGVHRRIKQGDDKAKSAIRRVFDTAPQMIGNAPVIYYPCEDDSDATTAASGLSGGLPMIASGGGSGSSGVRFGVPQGRTQAAYTGFEVARAGVKSWVALGGGGKLSTTIPPGTATTYTVQFANFTWTTTTDVIIARWTTPGGVFDRYDVVMDHTTQFINVIGYSGSTGTTIMTTNPYSPIDEWEYVFTQTQNGGNVDSKLSIQRSGLVDAFGLDMTDSRAGTLKLPTTLVLNANGTVIPEGSISGSENLSTNIKFSHVAVWFGSFRYMNDFVFNDATGTWCNAWNGWTSEGVTDRLRRLAAERGVHMEIVGSSDATMGFQDVASYVDLLLQPTAVDLGLLVDGLGPGYTYFTRDGITSQLTALQLDSAGGGDILGPNAPAHDDQQRVTDYTASSGTTAEGRFTAPGAPTSYEDGGEHRPYFDTDLAQIAAYKVGIGSARGLRWSRLEFELAKPATSTKIQPWLNARPGARIDVDGISQGSRPDRSMSLRGWREKINSKVYSVIAALGSYDPYTVATLAGDTGSSASDEYAAWLEVDTVTTLDDLAAGGTSVRVLVLGTTLTYPAVSTYTDDISGLYINLDGLRVGVTAISAPDAAGVQTISVTGADVLRRVGAGASVSAWDPVVLGL